MGKKSFRGIHYFLSNFYPCRNGVMYDGDIYPTSEHAYMAAKIEQREGRQSFVCGGSVGDNPMKAKQKGKSVRLRPGWDGIKVDVMLEVVRSKFQCDTVLQDALLATRAETLREEGTGDTFWGGTRNHLGNILMKVRKELRTEQQRTAQLTPHDDSDDGDGACPKQKERSKGNLQKRTLFEQNLKVYEGAAEVSTDHSDLDSEFDSEVDDQSQGNEQIDDQSVDAAPTETRAVPALSAEAQKQWEFLGKEAKAVSVQAATEEDVVQKCSALRVVVAFCRRAAALRPGLPMPLLSRSLAALESLELTMLDEDIEEDDASMSSHAGTTLMQVDTAQDEALAWQLQAQQEQQLASGDDAPAPTRCSVLSSQKATDAIQAQRCHDNSWHGWCCNACGHVVLCIDAAASLRGQCDDAAFVDATCAETIGLRVRPRGGRSRFSRKYDADHRAQI